MLRLFISECGVLKKDNQNENNSSDYSLVILQMC